METIVRPQTINGAICKSHLFNRERTDIKDQEVEVPKVLVQLHFLIIINFFLSNYATQSGFTLHFIGCFVYALNGMSKTFQGTQVLA